MSYSPFFTEVIAIISSGIDVPITRIIMVITFWLTCNASAILAQLFTAMSLPKDINIKPITEYRIDFFKFHFGVSFVFSFKFSLLYLYM